MKNLIKKMFSTLLILSLFSFQLTFAQEAEPVFVVPVPAEVVAPADPIPQPSESVPSTDGENQVVNAPPETIDVVVVQEEVVQETVSTQETVTIETLENTTNPESVTTEVSSTTVEIVADTASSTDTVIEESTVLTETIEEVPLEGESVLDVVADVVPETQIVQTDEPVVEVQSVAIAIEELVPEPEFAFVLTGDKIPTKKKVEGKNGKFTEEIVATPLTTTVDNEKGEVRISGSCSDVYFVVLLFKHEEDYRNDPASYIVNRAYECANNTFSYAISELPSSLPNGTYYLLVGEQGEKGAWKPVTELTEITINKN